MTTGICSLPLYTDGSTLARLMCFIVLFIRLVMSRLLSYRSFTQIITLRGLPSPDVSSMSGIFFTSVKSSVTDAALSLLSLNSALLIGTELRDSDDGESAKSITGIIISSSVSFSGSSDIVPLPLSVKYTDLSLWLPFSSSCFSKSSTRRRSTFFPSSLMEATGTLIRSPISL